MENVQLPSEKMKIQTDRHPNKHNQLLRRRNQTDMDPFSIRNNADLMRYWSTVQGRPWRNVSDEDKWQQRMTDQWNQFVTDHACPNYISMNFNKNGTRKTSQEPQSKNPCKKPGHCMCSDECFDRTNVMIEEQEQIMNDQPMSQPFHPSELISLPSYVTDIQQGMLPEDHELLTFIEQDYNNQRERAMEQQEAFLDDMEDIMDSMPCTQPGFDPSELFTPVKTQDDDHTSILAYDTDRTISYQSPDVRCNLVSYMSEYTTDSYDSDGYDGSVELTPDTP